DTLPVEPALVKSTEEAPAILAPTEMLLPADCMKTLLAESRPVVVIAPTEPICKVPPAEEDPTFTLGLRLLIRALPEPPVLAVRFAVDVATFMLPEAEVRDTAGAMIVGILITETVLSSELGM